MTSQRILLIGGLVVIIALGYLLTDAARQHKEPRTPDATRSKVATAEDIAPIRPPRRVAPAPGGQIGPTNSANPGELVRPIGGKRTNWSDQFEARRRWPLDSEGIKSAFRAWMPQLQECSGAWLEARGEEAEGTVVARFEIGPDDEGVGRVTAVELGASEVKHAAVEGCVLNVARSLEFEMSDGAGAVRVTYPIQFSRAEAAPDANRAAGAEPAP